MYYSRLWLLDTFTFLQQLADPKKLLRLAICEPTTEDMDFDSMPLFKLSVTKGSR